MRAEIAEAQGQQQKGFGELQLALVYDPESLYLLCELAELSLEMGKRRRASRLLERALRLAPRGPARNRAQLLRARLAILEGRFAAAEQQLRRTIRRAPKQLEAVQLLVDVLLKRYRTQAAIKVLRQAARRLPSAWEPLQQLAELEAQRGRYAAEAKALERAVQRNPGSAELLLALTTSYERLLRRDEALARWRRFVDDNPADPQGLFQAARMELSVGNDKRAEQLLALIHAQRQSVDHEYDIGRMLMSEGRYARAAQSLEEVVQQRPAHQGARYLLGLARYRARDDQGALSELEQLSPESDHYVEARLRIADILMMLGRFRRAELAVRHALKKRPEGPLWIKLAEIIERRSGAKIALELLRGVKAKERLMIAAARAELLRRTGRFEEGLKLLSALKGAVNERARLGELASLYEAASMDQKTVEALKRSLKLSAGDERGPSPARAMNFLGFYYAERNENLKEAERLLERAIALEPGDPAILDSLGWLFFQKGELSRAEPLLARASRLAPLDPEIAEHLGDLYAKQDDVDRAKAAYSRALEQLQRLRVARAPGREGDLDRVKRKRASLKSS